MTDLTRDVKGYLVGVEDTPTLFASGELKVHGVTLQFISNKKSDRGDPSDWDYSEPLFITEEALLSLMEELRANIERERGRRAAG